MLCSNNHLLKGGQADLENIKELLTFNGFENTRRQDYYNKEFGLELEDMHDENVIVKEEQARFLRIHAENNKLWIPALAEGSHYLTRGGESEIYLAPDHKHVIKINDAVYYAT